MKTPTGPHAMPEKTRFGSVFASFEGTPEEIFQYRLSGEQHCNKALKELVPVTHLPLLCKVGRHAIKEWRAMDGGGSRFHWGYCTRCNASFSEGWVESWNNLKRYTP